MCVFLFLFVDSFESANPNELKFQGMIFLGMQIVLINEQPDSANRLPENWKKLECVYCIVLSPHITSLFLNLISPILKV